MPEEEDDEKHFPDVWEDKKGGLHSTDDRTGKRLPIDEKTQKKLKSGYKDFRKDEDYVEGIFSGRYKR